MDKGGREVYCGFRKTIVPPYCKISQWIEVKKFYICQCVCRMNCLTHTQTHTYIHKGDKVHFPLRAFTMAGFSSPFNYPYKGIYLFLNETYLCLRVLKDRVSAAKWNPPFIHRSEMIVSWWSNYFGKNLSPIHASPHLFLFNQLRKNDNQKFNPEVHKGSCQPICFWRGQQYSLVYV